MSNLKWNGDDFRNSKESSGATADLVSHSGRLQQGYKHGSLTEGLVGYYPFDGDVTDRALGNDGTDNTSAGYVSGKVGSYAKDFDGTDDYVNVGYVPITFDGSEEFTIATWFKTSENADGTFVSLADDGSTNYRINQNSNGDWTLSFERAGNNTNAQTHVADGKWHHGVVRYSPTDGFTFYLDGNSDGTTGNSTWNYPGTEVKIGRRIDAGSKDSFTGAIDDLRIYERTLSLPEIKALSSISNPSTVSASETLQ